MVKPERETIAGPVAPAPSLVTENNSSEDDASNAALASRPRLKSKGETPTLRRAQGSSLVPPLEQPVANSAPSLEPPSPDANVKPVRGPSSHDRSLPDAKLAPAILDTLAGLLPSNTASSSLSSSLPSPVSEPNVSGQKSVGRGNEDWVILERKMQSLGVCRYTVEAEPGGQVMFSCLIPVAGRQAVTQRFEAEGDDLVQAAGAALRRIALWRATQPASR